jgi:hypothetical protein
MTNVPINGAGPSGKKKITGKELAAWLAHASLVTKLCVAAALATGELDPRDLTVAQIAKMLGLRSKQIRSIMALPAEQRAALTTKRRANNVEVFSNAVIDDIVEKVGAARMWSALDRATTPKTNGGMNGHAA